MGSFFSSSSSATEPEVELDEDGNPIPPPPKIEIFDHNAVRHCLDEQVGEALKNKLGYETDYYDLKIKLVVMAVASLFALLGQFLDKIFPSMPFPENRYYVGFCVLMYFVASGFLQILYSLGEENLMWKSVSHSETGITLLLKVVMEYTSDKYEVTFEYYNGDDKDNKQSVTETWDIGNYFDKHGNVHVYGIETAVINMHKKIVKSKIKKTQ